MRLARGHRLLALVLAGGLVSAPALAQPVDHEARGFELATAGRHAEALVEFEAAYAASRAPALLFAMGRMHAALGDCVRARDHFQRYLATQPGPRAAEAAHDGIDTCKPAAPMHVDAPPPPPVSEEVPEVPSPERRPARRSLAGAVVRDRLFQLGLGAGAIGAGLFVYSLQQSCWDGVCEGSYQDFESKSDRAPVIGAAAIGFGAVGGALVIAALIRQSSRRSGDDLAVTAAPIGGGGMIGVAGGF